MRNSKTYNTILKLHPEALSSTLEEKKAQISEVLLFLFLATSHNMMCVESKKLGLMRAKKKPTLFSGTDYIWQRVNKFEPPRFPLGIVPSTRRLSNVDKQTDRH